MPKPNDMAFLRFEGSYTEARAWLISLEEKRKASDEGFSLTY